MISSFIGTSHAHISSMLLMAFLATGGSTQIQIQPAAPTLADTATWLTNTYASHGDFDLNNGIHQTASVAIEGCSVRVIVHTRSTGPRPFPDTTDVTQFNLGKLDPSHATPHMNYEKTTASMLLRTWDGAQWVKAVKTTPDAAPHGEMRSEVNLLLPLPEYTRVAKAWVHAIQLCGGKASAF